MPLSGGLARWFRDQFGKYEKEVEKNTGISAYTLLELQTQDIPPGSEGVVVLPYFMQKRSPIWDPIFSRNYFWIVSLPQPSPVHRAMLEAAAYSLRHNMEEGIKAGLKLDPEC